MRTDGSARFSCPVGFRKFSYSLGLGVTAACLLAGTVAAGPPDEPSLGAGEAPVESHCDPESTPTPEPTVTPTPEPVCEYFTLDAFFEHDGDGYNHGLPMFTSVSGDVNKLYNLQCIKKIFDSCYVPEGTAPVMIGYERVRDDCVFLELMRLTGRDCGHLSAQQIECAKTNNRCKHTADPVKPSCRKHFNFTLDKDCNVISTFPAAKLCGKFKAIGLFTPLSLVWSKDTDIASVFSLAEFRLNPYAPPSWQTWRGSAETPLVVYDPERTGKVTSGSQLFGSWTFGGRGYASLSQLMSGASKSQWKDGYEALAQLDSNGNGKIDGDELSSLSLWFDRNQNAVSEPGEVVAISDTGVTALYFENGAYDPETRTTSARVGFDRIIDGKVVTGASVDWFADSAGSKLEMLQREQARLVLGRVNQASKPNELAAPKPVLSETASDNSPARFTGPWVWEIRGDSPLGSNSVNRGVLFLAVNPEEPGKIAGGSYFEQPIRSRAGAELRSISRMEVEGNLAADGKTLELRVTDGDKVLTHTTASLSDDGRTLSGESTATLPSGDSGSKTSSVKYAWTAQRY